MGWAKYCEDNIEIMLERQILRVERQTETKIIVDFHTAVRPAANSVVEEKPNAKETLPYEDKYIYCKECGKKFLFSGKQQSFFESRGWVPPKRCKCCREYNNARQLMRHPA